MAKYDIVIGGAGINGLTAAAYLVKAGLNVCVLEHQNYIGGGCISIQDPVVPGVIHDPCATVHTLIQTNPLIVNDELGLKSKYGLRYLRAEASGAHIFSDKGFGFTLYMDMDRNLQEIAEKISQAEADNYKKMYNYLLPIAQMMTQGLFTPPMPMVTQMSMLDGLGDLGKNMMRMMLMSAWDIVSEFLESIELREVITRLASEQMISPYEKGTGTAFMLFPYLLHDIGLPIAEGGSQKLSNALAQFIQDNGGTIRTGVTVKSVKIVGGEAKAFILAGGEEVEGTKGLLSTFHVKQLFGDNGMVDGSLLEGDFKKRIKNLRSSDYVALNQHLVLKDAPRYKLFDNNYSKAFITEQGEGPLRFKKIFTELSLNNPSPAGSAAICCQTVVDPSRAPNGLHTLYLYSYEPYALWGDPNNWAKHGQEIADQKLNALREITTNMGDDNILNRFFDTPLTFERTRPSWLGGDFCHIAQSMDQSAGNRPFYGMSRYKTPIDKLYIGGCCTFPGPTITGGGRAQVQVIFEDLDIDFDDVIRG